MSTVIAELSDDLERCRRERMSAEKVTQIENERLQEILLLCQLYNENNVIQKTRRFADVDCDRQTADVMANTRVGNDNAIVSSNCDAKTNASRVDNKRCDDHNNNDNKCDDNANRSDELDSLTSHLATNLNELQSEVSLSTLHSQRNSGGSNSSDSSVNTSNSDETISENLNNRNSGSNESLNALLMEVALINGELHDIQQQNFSDCDPEDEDLREFQRIEREIKVSELNKCLQTVQNQIIDYRKKANKKKKMSENRKLPATDYLDAPLAETESYVETEKEDSPEPKSPDSTSLELSSKELSLSPQQQTSHNTKKSQQRPLTLYLPSPDDELNLVNHIQTLGHDLTNQPSVIITPFTCSGYLYKLCSNSESKWRKRFFYFDRQYKVFVYYRSQRNYKKMRKPSGGVYFDEIHDVYVDHTKMKHKHSDNQNTRCVFIVAAARRQFVLSTFQPELMRIWIDVIFTGAQAYQDFND